jgi:hypothetical protein
MRTFSFSQLGGMCLQWDLSCTKPKKSTRGYSFDLLCDECGEMHVFFVQCDAGLTRFEVKVKAMCEHLQPSFARPGGPRERACVSLNFDDGLKRMIGGNVEYIALDSVFSRLKRATKGTHIEGPLLQFLIRIGRSPAAVRRDQLHRDHTENFTVFLDNWEPARRGQLPHVVHRRMVGAGIARTA